MRCDRGDVTSPAGVRVPPGPRLGAILRRRLCVHRRTGVLGPRSVCAWAWGRWPAVLRDTAQVWISRVAAKPRPGRRRRGGAMTASARHPAAQLRPGRLRQGGSMTASARHPAAQLRPERRRRGGSMTASARHSAAQQRPGRRRRVCSITARCPAAQPRPRAETRRWRVGTAAGEDNVADVLSRPPLSCVKQSVTSGIMPAPGDGGGAE